MQKIFKSKSKTFPNLSDGFDRRYIAKAEEFPDVGLSNDIVLASYDQVQSLLAVATANSIHVYGQNGVEVIYRLAAGREVVHLLLHKSHLVAIDANNTLYTWSLDGTEMSPVAVQALRGVVTTIYAEPSTDWLFLGMKDGTVDVWDLEGEQIVQSFKIKNQYFARQEEWRLMEEWYSVPRYHTSPIIGIEIHPLDLGMMLMTYPDGACLYSLKDGTTKMYYECILPPDGSTSPRKPILTCATFSPDGTFVVIGRADGTMAFFDAKEGESPVQVRNLSETDINMPRRQYAKNSTELQFDPVVGLKWCCRAVPEDSFLLVAGGASNRLRGVSILDYGKAPTKVQDYSEFFATPQRQKILPIDPREHVLSMVALGMKSPYHGVHDPRSVLLVTGTGTSVILDLPNGEPASASTLPASLSLSIPPITAFTFLELSRHLQTQLEGVAKRQRMNSSPLLIGGALKSVSTSAEMQLFCSIHGGTLLRCYQFANGQPRGPPLFELDTLPTLPNTIVEQVALSATSGEMALASESGTLIIYRLNNDSSAESDLSQAMIDLSMVEPMPSPIPEANHMLYKFDTTTNVLGYSPLCIIPAKHGQISALCVSDIGFVAVGYDSGYLLLIDLRGPAIFYAAHCSKLDNKRRESMFKKSDSPKIPQLTTAEHVTAANILSLALEGRNSLVVLLGTSAGRCIYLELLKETQGTYTALLSTVTNSTGPSTIREIVGCNIFGEDSRATGRHLSALHTDSEEPDCIVVISDQRVTTFNGLHTKIAHGEFRGKGALGGQLISLPQAPETLVLVVALKSGGLEYFSIPELQFLGSGPLTPNGTDHEVQILRSAYILTRNGKRGISSRNCFASNNEGKQAPNLLFDALKQPSIPRPTISNWSWMTGTQYIKSADLDLIITGGVRPLSKRAMERLAASQRQEALLEREAAHSSSADKARLESARNVGGTSRRTGRNAFGDMQQSGQERGERVSQVNDVFENITKASGEWLSEIDKMTASAKKSAGKAALKNFLGF